MRVDRIIKVFAVFLLAFLTFNLQAQDDLFGELDDMQPEGPGYVEATFKASRIVNSPSVELTAPGVMNFIVQHRFGTVDQGFYELFGLDQASTRISFDFGITPYLQIGIGRSGSLKTYDFNVKLKAVRQSKTVPVSVAYFLSNAYDFRKRNPGFELTPTNRLSYVHQILVARKFSENFSAQLTPMVVHRNLVATAAEANTEYALGFGFRQKVSKRVSINGEYIYLADQGPARRFNSAALGVDIETGGHVFSLHLANARGMFERSYIAEAGGDISQGQIYFGFNINRVFTIAKSKSAKEKGL